MLISVNFLFQHNFPFDSWAFVLRRLQIQQFIELAGTPGFKHIQIIRATGIARLPTRIHTIRFGLLVPRLPPFATMGRCARLSR